MKTKLHTFARKQILHKPIKKPEKKWLKYKTSEIVKKLMWLNFYLG